MRRWMRNERLAVCGLALAVATGAASRCLASPTRESRSAVRHTGSLTMVVSPAGASAQLTRLQTALTALPGVRGVTLGTPTGDTVEVRVTASAQLDGLAAQRTAQQLGFTVHGMSVTNTATGFQGAEASSIGGDPFGVTAFAAGRRWFGTAESLRDARRERRAAGGALD